MYCKKCGKRLADGDKFCSLCGARVEGPDLNKGLRSDSDGGEEKSKPAFHMTGLNWDLDGFPRKSKPSDNIDFNWSSVMEERDLRRFEEKAEENRVMDEEDLFLRIKADESAPGVRFRDFNWNLGSTTKIDRTENIEPYLWKEEDVFIPAPLREADGEAAQTAREGSDGEDPNRGVMERIVHKTAQKQPKHRYDAEEAAAAMAEGIAAAQAAPRKSIDKFYTFNKKNEEFQQLLDEEYERLRKRIKEENEAEEMIAAKQEKLDKARESWKEKEINEPEHLPVREDEEPELSGAEVSVSGDEAQDSVLEEEDEKEVNVSEPEETETVSEDSGEDTECASEAAEENIETVSEDSGNDAPQADFGDTSDTQADEAGEQNTDTSEDEAVGDNDTDVGEVCANAEENTENASEAAEEDIENVSEDSGNDAPQADSGDMPDAQADEAGERNTDTSEDEVAGDEDTDAGEVCADAEDEHEQAQKNEEKCAEGELAEDVTEKACPPSGDEAEEQDGGCADAKTEDEKTGEKKEVDSAKEETAGGSDRPHYSDIFADDDDDDDNPAEKKSGRAKLIVLDIIIVILVVVTLITAVMAFFPESAVASKLRKSFDQITSVMHSDRSEKNGNTSANTALPASPEASAADDTVAGQALKSLALTSADNITAISADDTLKFKDTYGVSASGFTDGEWPGDASAKKTSEKIVSTMIEYYSAYCERMNSGSDKVLSFIDNSSELYKQVEAITEGTDPHSISSLSFGDIVSEGNSYYSLVRVTDNIGGKETSSIYVVTLNDSMAVTAMTDVTSK